MPLFVAACTVPDGGLFRAARFRDVHLYQRYTEALLNGHVPYRDFFMEYPPGALAAAATHSHYNAAFKGLMALCGAIALVLVALLLVRLRASVARMWIAVLLVAASPVALGPISLNTYDAWPALLTLAALALLLARREVLALAVLGLAFASKVYPVVLLPVALVWTWRTRGRRTALAASGAFASVALVVVLPFLVLAPHGLVESFRAQAVRGLQIESLGAQLLVAADHLGVYSVTVAHHTRGAVTYDLRGSLPRALGALSSASRGCTDAAATMDAASSARSRQLLRVFSRSRASSRRSTWCGSCRSSRSWTEWRRGVCSPLRSCSTRSGSSTTGRSWNWAGAPGSCSYATSWSLRCSSWSYAVRRRKTSTPSFSKTSFHSGFRRSQTSCSAVASGA